jgi:deazaflavin-dependent oxidoreductase (nitroreductase family)
MVVVYLATSVLLVVVWRTRWRPGIDAIRRFNKKVRPVTLKVAGKRITTVHHAGRKSGSEYVTPVWAERSGRSFFIQLPYGTDVDWCRNVLAGGGCALERNGVRYETAAPVIVPAAEAVPLLPPGLRRMHRLAGVESYLRLDIGRAEKPAKTAG